MSRVETVTEWDLRRLVGEGRNAMIESARADVLGDLNTDHRNEPGAVCEGERCERCGATFESYALEIECGQHDWNLSAEAQAAARTLGVFGRSLS